MNSSNCVSSSASSQGVCLLIIDPQNDFHNGGSLAVSGADQDALRIAAFIRSSPYRDFLLLNLYQAVSVLRANSDLLSSVVVTLDSHSRQHIAHRGFWRDESGGEPAPFTQILHRQVGVIWWPRDVTLLSHARDYTRALDDKGRFTLTIWPDHCIVGSQGHAVVPAIRAATDEFLAGLHPFRSLLTAKKGMNDLTEMYSALCAEVPLPADPRTGLNRKLLGHLQRASKVVVCGQALSHCVNYSTRDLLQHWAPRDPADLIVLQDCSSSVAGFESAGWQFLADMRSAGVTVATSEAVTLTRLLASASPSPSLSPSLSPIPARSLPPASASVSEVGCQKWSVSAGEEESAEVRSLQGQLGGLLRESAAVAEQHLAAAQSRIRQQAGLLLASMQAAQERDQRAAQESLRGLGEELQRLRRKNARLEEKLDGQAQRCSGLLQDLVGSRRLLAALLHTPSTASSHSCSRGYGRPDLRSLLLRSVLQGWVAFAQTSKKRAERALKACLALRARRKKMILKCSFSALEKAGWAAREERRLRQVRSDSDATIQQLVARYEAEKVALTSDLQAASATVIREQRRRTQLEEDCHRLLLKGMTSLNMDALALFQNSKHRIFDDCPDLATAPSTRSQDRDRDREPDLDRKGLLGAFLAAKARQAAAEKSSIEPRARSGLPRPSPGPIPISGPGPAVVSRGGAEFGLGFGLGSGLSPPPPAASFSSTFGRTDQPQKQKQKQEQDFSDILWSRTLTREISGAHTASAVGLGQGQGMSDQGRARSRSGRRDQANLLAYEGCLDYT
eukprot:gene30472-39718_t